MPLLRTHTTDTLVAGTAKTVNYQLSIDMTTPVSCAQNT